MDNKTYIPLEPSFSQSLGIKDAPAFKAGEVASLFTSTSFLYSFAIMLSVVAAGVMYARAGIYRMQASEAGVRKSNDEIKRTTIGLLGVLSLFVIIYTFNKGLLTGDVGLDGLKVKSFTSGGGGVYGGGGATAGDQGPVGASCQTKEATISALTSSAGICGNARCTVLSGCNYKPYLSTIQSESAKVGVDYKVVVALMCRESRGDVNAKSSLPENGSYDCGLMQVNQPTACTTADLEPTANIIKGITLIKQKLSQSTQRFPNIPQELGAYASYNCCGGTTVPNAPSADCTQQSGFPFSIPKWACPIDPGQGKFNMCFVKGYVCEIDACVKQLGGM